MRIAVLAIAIVFHPFVFGNCVRSRATPLENFNSESAANALEHNEADEADEGTRLDTVTLHGPILSASMTACSIWSSGRSGGVRAILGGIV